MVKFHGSAEELQSKIESAGHIVENVENDEGETRIRTSEGAVLRWFKSTGTLQVQGKQPAKGQLSSSLESLFSEKVQERNKQTNPALKPIVIDKISTPDSIKIFVVHGHDSDARDQLELVLHKLGLDSFVLQNTAGGGLTIIEALEKEIGPTDDAARFGIVLLTPDDVGYAVCCGEDSKQPRARQNVVLEMGMLIAAFGRKHVAILQKGELEIPSDVTGIIYIPFDKHVKETVPKLAQRLCDVGFDITRECIINASS